MLATDKSSDTNSGTSIGDSYTYTWNFGDGTATTTANTAVIGNNQSHSYSTDGTYNISLNLLDAFGLSSSFSSPVTVATPPPAPISSGGSGFYSGFYSPAGQVSNILPNIVSTTPKESPVKKQEFVFVNIMKRGSTGADVTALQNRLTEEEIYDGPITGYFGNLTFNAVVEYQKNNNLPATGFVGPMTIKVLNSKIVKTITTPTTNISTTTQSTSGFVYPAPAKPSIQKSKMIGPTQNPFTVPTKKGNVIDSIINFFKRFGI